MDPHAVAQTVQMVRPDLPTAEQVTDVMLARAAAALGAERAVQYRAVAAAAARDAQRRRTVQAARTATARAVGRPHAAAPSSVVTAATTGDYASVRACIKGAESGNYASNTHGASGASGAYQIERSTWTAYAPKVGVGAAAAYLASPAEQDAVVNYMLSHGGAHNWDPRFGRDSCTTRLP